GQDFSSRHVHADHPRSGYRGRIGRRYFVPTRPVRSARRSAGLPALPFYAANRIAIQVPGSPPSLRALQQFHLVAGPQAVAVAEGSQSALRADASSRQYEYTIARRYFDGIGWGMLDHVNPPEEIK